MLTLANNGHRHSNNRWTVETAIPDPSASIPVVTTIAICKALRREFVNFSGNYNEQAAVRASFEDVETQLKNLTDEQFYYKLQQLKEANRKTLEECEKLYKEKYGGRPGKEKDKWRHRITIPKPFEMMMREEMKEKKKTKAQIELEEERRAKEREEEAECQKKFHAQPAPAHIYLPLYDEIMEKNEARRRFVQENSKELLLSKVKPFNFEKRELEKKGQLKHTVTVAERIARNKAKLQKAEQQFKAKPVPEFVRTTDVNEKHLAEEEFRKIRIRMRARELMQTASLPPNMAMQQKLKEQIEKEKILAAKKRARSGNAKRRTRSSREVPDYDFLYREFQKELTRRKQTREGTVMEPFALETGKLRSSREKVMRDMEKDAQTLRENRWPFQNPTPRSCLQRTGLASSLDSIPFKSTSTHDRRKEFLKSQMAREQHAAEMRKEEERRREMRQSQLRKYINDHSTEPSPRDYIKDRLKQHKAAEKSRQEQYEKDKEEMWSRVQKRPLLFEQETQTSAGKAAEKKFQTTLKNAGVDEEYVQTQSSRATRPYSDDDDNGAGDTTRLKTADQYEEDFE
nr:hypothetical protein BaRGS_020113 [Batillaria attramentaria]